MGLDQSVADRTYHCRCRRGRPRTLRRCRWPAGSHGNTRGTCGTWPGNPCHPRHRSERIDRRPFGMPLRSRWAKRSHRPCRRPCRRYHPSRRRPRSILQRLQLRRHPRGSKHRHRLRLVSSHRQSRPQDLIPGCYFPHMPECRRMRTEAQARAQARISSSMPSRSSLARTI